jgi:transmembrane sensor
MRDELTGHGPDELMQQPNEALDRLVSRWALNVPDTVDVEAALARVAARRVAEDAHAAPVDELAARRAQRASTRPAPLWARSGVRIAATLLLGLGGAAIWRGLRGTDRSSVSFTTATAVSREITLVDGTHVRLAPGSSLTTTEGFGVDARAVTLSGEAWFDVVHDASRPFSVRAGDVDVRDIGTAFLVRESDAGEVTVRVVEGEVEIRRVTRADSAVRLRAGDAATVRPDSVLLARHSVTPLDSQSLAAGRLVFHDAALTEVVSTLRRWYGIRLEPDASLQNRKLTADLTGEPVSRIASVLGLTFGARATVHGDTIVLRDAAEVPTRR